MIMKVVRSLLKTTQEGELICLNTYKLSLPAKTDKDAPLCYLPHQEMQRFQLSSFSQDSLRGHKSDFE